FLQKPDAAALRRHEALDPVGRALIDTGLLSFDPSAVDAFCRAAGLAVRDGQLVQRPGLLADIESGAAAEIDAYEEVALAPADRAFAFNCVVETDAVNCGDATLLEGCHVRGPLDLAGRNIVTNWPGEDAKALRLPEGVGLVMLPAGQDGWAAVYYGVDDDFR